MNDCLFCELAVGTKPISKVYEDDHVLAILDINPINHGHTLLIPKNHSRNLFDINDEDMGYLMALLPRIARAVKEGVRADGINIHINNEESAGQVIFHTHIHIIPRFSDDDVKMWRGKPYKEGEADDILKKITNILQKQ